METITFHITVITQGFRKFLFLFIYIKYFFNFTYCFYWFFKYLKYFKFLIILFFGLFGFKFFNYFQFQFFSTLYLSFSFCLYMLGQSHVIICTCVRNSSVLQGMLPKWVMKHFLKLTVLQIFLCAGIVSEEVLFSGLLFNFFFYFFLFF